MFELRFQMALVDHDDYPFHPGWDAYPSRVNTFTNSLVDWIKWVIVSFVDRTAHMQLSIAQAL